MPMAEECRCGARVSDAFARVFTGRDGVVHACHRCATPEQLRNGAVAGRLEESATIAPTIDSRLATDGGDRRE